MCEEMESVQKAKHPQERRGNSLFSSEPGGTGPHPLGNLLEIRLESG